MKSFLPSLRQLDLHSQAKPSINRSILKSWLDRGLNDNNASLVLTRMVGCCLPLALVLLPPQIATANVCSAAGGTLGANLFSNNGSFGTGSSTPGTTGTALPAGRTTYLPVTYGGNAPQDGEYSIVNQLNQTTFNYWFNPVFGHTTGTVTDQMMVVNASFNPGNFYAETLTVPANQTLDFGFWIVNLPSPNSGGWTAYAGGTAGDPNASGGNIKPDISLVINRIGVDDNNNGTIDEAGEGQVITTTGAIPFTSSPTWARYGALFNTGNATQIEFRLVNNAPGGVGNDLALDDLLVAPCTLSSGNITGTLYRDQNTNNAYNSGTDLTLPANIAVNLKNSTGGIVATVYTNASGSYNFTNVPAGSNYTIEAALTDPDIPSGATATANPGGANTTGTQTGITVTSGTTLANQNFGFSPLPVSISGTVFEDPNYGGGAGRPLSTASTAPRNGATVELYKSDGTYISSTTTSGSGQYTFNSLMPGDYFVRVVNSTVTSSRPGAVSTLIPVQTFRVNDSTGTPANDSERVGGEKPSVADTGAAGAGARLNTTTFAFTTAGGSATIGSQAQSIAPVKVITAAVAGIDFGYNFDTIVNTNNSGQGSLRQFITNSNALSNSGLAQVGLTPGTETSIFMIPSGIGRPGILATVPSQLTNGVARIVPTSSLPAIIDDNTAIDGTTQTANIGDTNSGQVGSGGKVGTGPDGRENTGDEPTLSKVNKPEVEIKGNNTIAIGLDLKGNNETVRGLAIYGYGLAGNASTGPLQGDIISRGTGEVIEANLLGSAAANLADPGAGSRTEGAHVYLDSNSNTTISNNIIAYSFHRGIFSTETGVVNFTITNNEIRDNNREDNNAGGGIEFTSFAGTFGGSTTSTISPQGTISGNLISNNSPTGQSGKDNGIEFGGITGGVITVQDNTISGNSTGIAGYSLKTPKPHTDNVLITHNIINNNFGPGININSMRGFRFVQNSIYDNIGLGIQLGAGSNDGNYDTTVLSGSTNNFVFPPGNDAIDYPIVNSASLTGGTLNVSGFIGSTASGTNKFANATIEFFIADNDPADQNMKAIVGDALEVPHGEGRTYIGTCTATANSLFSCSFPNAGSLGLTDPKNITATTTLTRPDGSIISSQFGPVVIIKPNVLLVKRITAVNNNTTNGSISLNAYDPEPDLNNPAYPYDKNVIKPGITPPNSDKWPNTSGSLTSSFLLGARYGGTTKPTDSIEYTIYFLSAGEGEAKNVLLCDRVPANVTFSPHTFTSTTTNPGGIARGIAVQLGNNPLNYYTNTADSDDAQYFPPGIEPSTVYPNISCGKNSAGIALPNDNGAVVVNLRNRPKATGILADDQSNGAYGFMRFRGVVK